jgi:MoxR-like ATPase
MLKTVYRLLKWMTHGCSSKSKGNYEKVNQVVSEQILRAQEAVREVYMDEKNEIHS